MGCPESSVWRGNQLQVDDDDARVPQMQILSLDDKLLVARIHRRKRKLSCLPSSTRYLNGRLPSRMSLACPRPEPILCDTLTREYLATEKVVLVDKAKGNFTLSRLGRCKQASHHASESSHLWVLF